MKTRRHRGTQGERVSRGREGRRCWRRGKGGTTVILSALRAVSDLSGLREERRASVVPCDPRLCFMARCRSLSVWEKTGKPEELRLHACVCVCAHVCVCVCVNVCLVCVRFLPLKQSRGQSLVCTNVKCVCGCVVPWFLPLKQSRGQRLVCLQCVCVCVCVCV